jgi:DNA helicase-2/ATP-dependent DNA helicase PcrA
MVDLRWDTGLDDNQLAAATAGPAPLVVMAGAGTGKTRTLTSRVAHLLQSGVAPERILLLTFTRRAAEDMLGRVAAVCGDGTAARRVWGGTFHAVAHRLVAEHAATLGLEQLSVLDPADVVDLVDLLRDEYGLAADDPKVRMPRAGTIADVYSRSVNTGRTARDVVASDFPWCEPHVDAVLALLRGYLTRKRDRGLLDFDDLLLSWRALLDDPAVGERLRRRWDHVLVDEYQDVNQIQVDIVTRLRPDGDGLTVVGDDAQALYAFRGAGSGQLLDLLDSYPAARLVKLERNFRSRQPLLDLANVVRPGTAQSQVTLVADRTDTAAALRRSRPALVRCHDAGDEARQVVESVLAAVEDGSRLRDHAVLMRTSHHSDLLEVELTARRIPYVKFGGLKFLEAAHVKDFLAGARVAVNPRDELAWFRLLRLHAGAGPARARAITDLLLARPDDVNAAVAAAPPVARVQLGETLEQVCAARLDTDPQRQAARCLAAVRPLVEGRYRDAAARVADLERLAETAGRSADLGHFVAEVTLDPPVSSSDYAKPPHLDDDYLTLSTVHSAKGLEWPTVHVIHAVDGAFPSDMALSSPDGVAEEQRVFYVAVTRAQERLRVYTPLRMPHHRRARDDRHSYAPQSRFLTDDAVAVMDVQQPRAGVGADAAAPVDVALPAARVAVPTPAGLFE